jgi:hypothetical protein
MRRIFVVLLIAAVAALFCLAAASLGPAWAQIVSGERAVSKPVVLGSIAVLAAPFLTAYVVRFERRVRVEGRAQLAALERLYPGSVIFTAQAVPETAAGLTRLRTLAGASGPAVRADHRPLTVTVSRYDVSVWEGRHEPRRLALIPARVVVQVSLAGTPVLVGLDKRKMLPSVGFWLRDGSRLVLPALVVRPRVVKPGVEEVGAIAHAAARALHTVQPYSLP